jgi:hypothetical protein
MPAQLGRYCKAYLAKRFREFPGWEENLEDLRKETVVENRVNVEIQRTEIKDDDVLYLQENYIVTDDIYKDRNLIFDKVDDEWKKFCDQVLEFEIPEFTTLEPTKTKSAEIP